jgi:pyruvate, orthophosphate dikinase
MAPKYVYSFGSTGTDGDASQRNLLGGKGANLAEMCNLKLPVPAGFTITTDCCTAYFAEGQQFPASLKAEVEAALKLTEKAMDMKYGDAENPLLISSRSGARSSMPGMMETVLNVGLCTTTIPGLVKKSGSERFVYDAYRRLITMYSDVVMEKSEGVEPEEGKGIRNQLEQLMDAVKEAKGVTEDTDLSADDLKTLCEQYKVKVKEVLGRDFPDDAMEQLWGAVGAVFKSWNGKRAIAYRRIEGIPDAWGTAVNVQSMVFGNMGDTSATGVAFSRNPATGENKFYGEWLINAQGEDVVAGIRTPSPLNEETKNDQNRHLDSLETEWAESYKELHDIRDKLESHYKDMQDIEFTIQDGTLYMLQCRSGKRTGTAALNMAMDMIAEGLIDEETSVNRVAPEQLDELLHPIIDPEGEKNATPFVKGLPAGPGGACGEIVFTSDAAVEAQRAGKKCLLVREETNPEDVEGMRAADGILTARGGMTSHAALLARGWGKCCIVGAGELKISASAGTMTVGDKTFKAGDVITLNGTRGLVYEGAMQMMDASENPRFQKYMEIVDKFRTMGVRTNADTPEDAKIARDFGAEGIGLFRTEHMFYGAGTEEALFILRKMIHAGSDEERNGAIDELAPFVKRDIKATMEAMDGLPVTVRLLDPPLHEFVPQEEGALAKLAEALNCTVDEVKRRGLLLHEVNPMMGHRGVRLGITYAHLTEMQIRAILEAAAELKKDGKDPKPEIMVPVTCTVKELDFVKPIFDKIQAEIGIDCLYGTMIEIPRAALLADKMAETAQFFSFGTNDLTQMGFGFSRDDIGGFLQDYLDQGILEADPFQTIDQEGIGQLIEFSVERGRKTRPELKIGICGEQGGDPASVDFCFKNGLNYVSCSPYRVPIARLAAAQSALKAKK